jgi:hypothetical protein
MYLKFTNPFTNFYDKESRIMQQRKNHLAMSFGALDLKKTYFERCPLIFEPTPLSFRP